MEELHKNYDLKEKGEGGYTINEKIECVLDTKEPWEIEKVGEYNLQSIEKYMNTIVYLIKHAEELEESSSYSRAKGTAKYIVHKNKLDINIDSRLNERKLGSLEDLAKWMEGKKYGVVQSYLLDRTYLLTNWCELNEDVKLIWNNKIIEIKEPSVTKLTFNDGNLIDIESINI